jgi:hypothetical protein
MAFLQQDGKIYVASNGVAATEVVASGRQIAKLNGAVTIDLTWSFASARWRTRAIQDHDAFAIDGSINAEEVEWVASVLNTISSNCTVGSQALYGTALSTGGNTTANFWRITTSTVPKNLQWVFQFRRSDDNKLMQIYAPKAKLENYPAPFAVEDYTKQSLTWRLLASTNGKLIEVNHAVSTAGAPG